MTQGHESINNRFLKEVENLFHYVTPLVIHFYWYCPRFVEKGNYIMPVFMKSDPSEASNYRPISLVCILSKVMETIVHNIYFEIVEFLQLCSLMRFYR